MLTRNQVWYLDSLRINYLETLHRRRDLEWDTLTEYNRILCIATEEWIAAGFDPLPKRVGEDHIVHLHHVIYPRTLSPYQNRKQIAMVGQYLEFHGNPIVKKMMIPWPPNTRPNAQWYTDEEAVRMLDASERNPMWRMLMHLELRMLCRRVDAKRLTIKDVELNMLQIRGKGRQGGKWRTLAWAPETLSVVQEYSDYREELISNALEIEPDQTIPPQVMIYAQYGWKLGAMQEGALDNMLKDIAAAAGIPYNLATHHTNRRSGAGIYIRAKVPVRIVMAALGHKSEAQTWRYAGMHIEDMAENQPLVTSYLQNVRARMVDEPYRAESYRPVLISR